MKVLERHELEEAIVKWQFDDSNLTQFEISEALTVLLSKEVVFVGSYWWKEDWPEECRKLPALAANCGDTFGYACADSEEVAYDDIRDLYEHFAKDEVYGPTVWVCKKRNEMPISPIVERIRNAGVWDIDSLGLDKNGVETRLAKSNTKSDFIANLAQKVQAIWHDLRT